MYNLCEKIALCEWLSTTIEFVATGVEVATLHGHLALAFLHKFCIAFDDAIALEVV